MPLQRCGRVSRRSTVMRLGANYCPGILHAVPARDGLLLRIRVPGGLITATQLRTVADVSEHFADSSIEITSRANLQLRAIHERHLMEIADSLAAIGLLPSPLHERVRNIATSPFAGIAAGERVDTRPLILQLDRCLIADPVFAGLHPKFNFGIYGACKRHSREVDDLSLEPIERNGELHFRLLIDGIDSGFATPVDCAVDRLLEVAKVLLALATKLNIAARARRVIAMPAALEEFKESLAQTLTSCPSVAQSNSFVEQVPGIFPAADAGRVNIIPSVPLGRLTTEQGRHVADAARYMKADLRLAPWRGVVIGAIPKSLEKAAIEGLQTAGLACNQRDGYQGIAACAGIAGCDAALADVRGDAALLARSLEGQSAPSEWTVNLSGCEKQCGRRHGAIANLVAEPSGYRLRLRGQPEICGCSSDFTLHAITALHAEMTSAVVAR